MPSSARRTYYMHTLDGKPAQFCFLPGDGDCYIAFGPSGRFGRPARLAESLAQIRREQQAAVRANRRLEPGYFNRLGYVRVEVPDAE